MQINKVKQELKNWFDSRVIIQDKVVKTTVPTINGGQIAELGKLWAEGEVDDIELKRSGTSITILVTVVV